MGRKIILVCVQTKLNKLVKQRAGTFVCAITVLGAARSQRENVYSLFAGGFLTRGGNRSYAQSPHTFEPTRMTSPYFGIIVVICSITFVIGMVMFCKYLWSKIPRKIDDEDLYDIEFGIIPPPQSAIRIPPVILSSSEKYEAASSTPLARAPLQ